VGALEFTKPTVHSIHCLRRRYSDRRCEGRQMARAGAGVCMGVKNASALCTSSKLAFGGATAIEGARAAKWPARVRVSAWA